MLGYTVEMFGRNSTEGWVQVATRIQNTTYKVLGLSSGVSYYFAVRAENSHGVSGPSQLSEPITMGAVREIINPFTFNYFLLFVLPPCANFFLSNVHRNRNLPSHSVQKFLPKLHLSSTFVLVSDKIVPEKKSRFTPHHLPLFSADCPPPWTLLRFLCVFQCEAICYENKSFPHFKATETGDKRCPENKRKIRWDRRRHEMEVSVFHQKNPLELAVFQSPNSSSLELLHSVSFFCDFIMLSQITVI